MIPRYTLPEMAELFSDHHRYATWVRVEILASEAQARLGHVPERAVADMRRAKVPLPARVAASSMAAPTACVPLVMPA